MTVAQDGDAAVAPPDVIKHVDVDRKKPVLHLKRTPSSPSPDKHYSAPGGPQRVADRDESEPEQRAEDRDPPVGRPEGPAPRS
jgi:hypothetical protein